MHFGAQVRQEDVAKHLAQPDLYQLELHTHALTGWEMREVPTLVLPVDVDGYHEVQWRNYQDVDYARSQICERTEDGLQCKMSEKPWLAGSLPEPGILLCLFVIVASLTALHWFDLWRIGGRRR